MYIQRHILQNIKDKMYKGKVIVLYGPRQVGKTTLCKEIVSKESDSRYLSCDEPNVREALTNKSSLELYSYIGRHKLVIIDEAQMVQNIGLTLKLLVDNYPEMQIIATGSSSFDLANKINEPLTGRNYEFHLYPFSIGELVDAKVMNDVAYELEDNMIYGLYPLAIFDKDERNDLLLKLATDTLYKDVLMYQDVRKPEMLEKLLRLLALQIGNEVSMRELGNALELSKETVEWYIRLLEQAFIIFRLPALGRNKRKEVTRLQKIYFYDVGIRNALIRNLNPLSIRTDVGALFENMAIMEMKKHVDNTKKMHKMYFWRTKIGSEVDLVLESAGQNLAGYECKWKKDTFYPPEAWKREFPDASFESITRATLQAVVGKMSG